MNKTILIATLLLTGRLSAQCPYFVSCQPDSLNCDYSTNDPLLWKAAPYTWNQCLMLSDLPEGDIVLRMSALDSCGSQNLSVEYTLFLDLDGNDTAETVIQSNSALSSGKVLFNNISSQNYAQGDTLAFDLRPGLPDSMRYRFGLKLQHLGDSVVAQLMWTTGIVNLNYSAPQLPLGKHRILWRIGQGGGAQVCESDFELKDCAPPVVTCLGNLSVNIMPTGNIQLWASDFLFSISDNIMPAPLEIATRKWEDNASGFPLDTNGNPILSVVFDCFDAWFTPQLHIVELWVRDKAGNTDSCLINVFVGLGGWDCNFDPTILHVSAQTESLEFIENVACLVEGTHHFSPPFSLSQVTGPGNISWATFLGEIGCGSDFTIVPSRKDNPLNGVTTYDLVLISKHILGTQPLTSPYKMIAADANKSGSITTFDIVEFRKLILGIYDTLPNNDSWRFLKKDFVFPNASNPFQTDLPDTLIIENWNCYSHEYFTGIKVGDLNNTAIPNATTPPPAESRTTSFLTLPDLELKSGEIYEIPIHNAEISNWLGLQLGLEFDPELLEIEALESSILPNFDQNNWAQPQAGRLTLSWSSATPHRILPNAELLRLRVKAHADIRLSSAFKTAEPSLLGSESYDTEGFLQPLNLAFSENNDIESIEIFAPQPNPTRTGVILPIQLAQTETLRLEVLDLNGKLIWTNDCNLDQGSHTLEIPASALPHSGVYIWQLQAGSVVWIGKVTKI
jgi:hypothetical protein